MMIRSRISFTLLILFTVLIPISAYAGQTLYNGIVLPDVWPPANRELTREPMRPPYLDAPPETILIDVGRQLFVDDFLIEQTDMKRVFHAAEQYSENPVLKPDKPWETTETSQGQPAPTAMAFSDGVWFDPKDQLFKMWYMGGFCASTCYAFSKDGIHWEKPSLDVVPGTNIVHKSERDSNVVWLDLNEKDPARRFKMIVFARALTSKGALSLFFSADGVHWGDCVAVTGPTGDRSTAFYNPFRNVWVYNIRAYDKDGIGRYRRYWENPDILAGVKWEKGEPPFWVGADSLDSMREDLKTPCELYNLDVVAYESVCLGLFNIWRGQPKDRGKPNEILLGFSRDGFNWSRPSHDAFIPVSEKYGDWNWTNIQSAGGCCLVVGDKLYFYYSGRSGVKGSEASGVSATGLAMLRRDGFASMEASENEASLTTRVLRYSGKRLFVNADVARGSLTVEILGKDGQPFAGFAGADCVPVSMDSTRAPIAWKAGGDLSSLAGKEVRFRFHVRNGGLYSFWVSPDDSGASNGYVAAGGPGYVSPSDTTGAAR